MLFVFAAAEHFDALLDISVRCMHMQATPVLCALECIMYVADRQWHKSSGSLCAPQSPLLERSERRLHVQ
jgi:hypothetical protein